MHKSCDHLQQRNTRGRSSWLGCAQCVGVARTATCGLDSLVGKGHSGFSIAIVGWEHCYFEQRARKQPHNGDIVALHSEYDDEKSACKELNMSAYV
jgi:hypothetical protein